MIRHGDPVGIEILSEEKLLPRLEQQLDALKEKGYHTIAVICRTEEEAAEHTRSRVVREFTPGDETFQQGVMVLPIELTKGLEFDAVILWKPDQSHYENTPKEAKLLYVAITRALHELHLLSSEPLSPLLS